MCRVVLIIVSSVFWTLSGTQQSSAERLGLSFLPPDFPRSNICGAEPEQRDPEELQDGTLDDAETVDAAAQLEFLIRDIRDLTNAGADRWFDYIMTLITRRKALDPGFSDVEEAFARIDVFLAASRLDELRQRAIVDGIRLRIDELSNNQKVKLAWFYRTGIGAAENRFLAERLITEAAYAGNADALLVLVRMQLAGETVEDWDLPIERTATLAFGGVIGQLNRGLCNRAERMAREYTDGEILAPNPDLAYAWRKFAADMGGAEAAWRIVEHHLNATAPVKDDEVLLHYLRLAVENGYPIRDDDLRDVIDSGAATEAQIRETLRFNYNRVGLAFRRSAVPYLDLRVKLTGEPEHTDGDYLPYLREIAALPGVPGPVLTKLAKEILLRRGRWAGEVEATEVLEKAAMLDDPEAITMLAEILVRHRDDKPRLERAEGLLIDAVSRLGHGEAMNRLDALYRCRLPDAPLSDEANFWSAAYRAADIDTVGVSATDLARFDAAIEPEAVAKIQSLALLGHGSSTADHLQLLQSDPLASDQSLQFWAMRVSRSDQALEEYVIQELELAPSSGARKSAIELFRRAYLDIGASISLDLAVALVQNVGRDPDVADEVERLLVLSGLRGEGAAIRLLQRLNDRDAASVYNEFADEIERNGDFLALMFAAPHVPDDRFHDYMNRAVSVMNCSTKDVAEMADAYAIRGHPDQAYHWQRIGLAMESGHVLSKLGISDRQMADFDRGAAPTLLETEATLLALDEVSKLRRKYLVAADPDGEAYDPKAAAELLISAIGRAEPQALPWALGQYRRADRRLQKEVEGRVDIRAVYESAAEAGDSTSQFELGMLLRSQASGAEDLTASTDWLGKAAEAGHVAAIVEFAFAIGFGLGVEADPKLALIWLQKADGLGSDRARDLIRLFDAVSQK